MYLFWIKLHTLLVPLPGHFTLEKCRHTCKKRHKIICRNVATGTFFQWAWVAIFPRAMLWKLFSNVISFYIGISVTYHPVSLSPLGMMLHGEVSFSRAACRHHQYKCKWRSGFREAAEWFCHDNIWLAVERGAGSGIELCMMPWALKI